MAFAVKSTVRAHGPRAASSLVAPRTGSYSQARSIRTNAVAGAPRAAPAASQQLPDQITLGLAQAIYEDNWQDPIRNVLGGVYADNYGMRLVKADETDEYEKSYPEVRVAFAVNPSTSTAWIAVRGTEKKDLGNLVVDGALAIREMGDWGHISRIFSQRMGPPLGALAVIEFVDEQIQAIQKEEGFTIKQVHITGHSLGGYLSKVIAADGLSKTLPKADIYATVYDSTGLSEAELKRLGALTSSKDRIFKVAEYLSWPNVVNMLGDHDCSACSVANVLIPFDDDPKAAGTDESIMDRVRSLLSGRNGHGNGNGNGNGNAPAAGHPGTSSSRQACPAGVDPLQRYFLPAQLPQEAAGDEAPPVKPTTSQPLSLFTHGAKVVALTGLAIGLPNPIKAIGSELVEQLGLQAQTHSLERFAACLSGPSFAPERVRPMASWPSWDDIRVVPHAPIPDDGLNRKAMEERAAAMKNLGYKPK